MSQSTQAPKRITLKQAKALEAQAKEAWLVARAAYSAAPTPTNRNADWRLWEAYCWAGYGTTRVRIGEPYY